MGRTRPSEALIYLAPAPQSFWRWEDHARVVVWSDGRTIAFRQEIEEILERLAPGGLPPFDAVLLLLAACRDNWPGEHLRRGPLHELAREITPRTQDETATFRRYFRPLLTHVASDRTISDGAAFRQLCATVFESLDRVNAICRDAGFRREDRAVLAEMLFEPPQHHSGANETRDILDTLRRGFPPGKVASPALAEARVVYSQVRFVGALVALWRGLAHCDLDRLELRRRTGLDELPRAAEIDLPPREHTRRFLSALREDPQLSGLARLALDLMAAVHIPRSLSEPEELPTGGFSDIANRGSPDHLLPSELAHDELTLTVRIVLGEALYFRREAPPRTPTGHRVILLDTGIRLWGVPRVFAAAVALAMAATADSHVEIRAFRATPEDVEPVDLTSRDGLIELLENLETEPHPAGALDAFLEAAGAGEGATDAIVITHAETVSDADFLGELYRRADPGLFVATVDSDGFYRLERFSPRGRKVLREARLRLDAVLSAGGKMPGEPVLRGDVDPALPAILAVSPFPLLLPERPDPACAAWHPRLGAVAATRDGRLLRWRDPERGATQVADGLPPGTIHRLWVEGGGIVRILIGGGAGRAAHLVHVDLHIDLHGGLVSTTEFHPTRFPPLHVWLHQEVLSVITRRTVEAFHIGSGDRVDRLELPFDVYWSREHLFQDTEGILYALALGDGKLCLSPLLPAPDTGVEPREPSRREELDRYASRRHHLRTNVARFRSVGITRDHRLGLLLRDGHGLLVTLDSNGWKMRFERTPGQELIDPATLESHRGAPATRFRRLAKAEWRDGSRVWVDGRGLLHLQSGDADLPEVTLVLVDQGATAGWASNGQLHGSRFFTGDRRTVDGSTFYRNIKRFIDRLGVKRVDVDWKARARRP